MNNLPDRFLRIEVLADMIESSCGAEGCQCSADSSNNHKHHEEVAGEEKALDIMDASVEQIIPFHNPETEATICEAADGDDPYLAMEYSGILRVTTLHVSSTLLARKSPFFCKLFSNGMRESNQRHVSLRINASEEAALMHLLNFMESDILAATTVSALLDVLKAADKYEVSSCLVYCSDILFNMPMTLESAVQYLELPPSVQIGAAIQPLVDAAKSFLAASYKDVRRYKDKICCLSLAGLQAVLSSNDLQVSSEDALYDIVMEWAKVHYPILEERREILTTSLGHYIRFPYMSFWRLKKILSCNDFDDEFASRVVLEALIFKALAPCHQQTLAADESISRSHRFVERAYKYRPIKVVEFDHPCKQCVVYLDLKRQECRTLYPSRRIYSQAFQLGGQGFFLSASCNFDEECACHSFGLFLGMKEKNPRTFEIKYEFSARSKVTEEFIGKHKGNYTFRGGKAVGSQNLFGVPWQSFLDEDSLYFIDGILHLRAEITIGGDRDITLSL